MSREIGVICSSLFRCRGLDFFCSGNLRINIELYRFCQCLNFDFPLSLCRRTVLPESPRWLLAKGRIEELKKIIETAARWNKRPLPPNYDKLLIPPPEEESSGSFIDLFKLEYLRTTLLLMVAWYCFVLQYMALTLHIGEMGGNIYLTTVCLNSNTQNIIYQTVRIECHRACK